MEDYRIQFNPTPFPDPYPNEPNLPITILRLSDQQIVGLIAGIKALLPTAHTYAYFKITRIRDNANMLSLATRADNTQPFMSYILGGSNQYNLFEDSLEDQGYRWAVNLFVSIRNGNKLRFENITKRYSVVLPFDYNRDAAQLYQFDTMEFIQGILTACQWMQKDCQNLIKYVFYGENQLEVNQP